MIELELNNDDHEQYICRHNLRISGIPENVQENTDDLFLNLFTNTIKVYVDMKEIDRSHRVVRPGSKHVHLRYNCAFHLLEIPTENNQAKKSCV